MVVDVLRFSTTVVRAFELGARAVRPVRDVAAAAALVQQGEAELACGERGGVKPAGFHLGNSPFEYTAVAVAGRRLAFTTTNGTRALLACAEALPVLVGCFRNLASVAAVLAAGDTPVLVACGGTDGRFSLEDALAAGALCEQLSAVRALSLTDGAKAARSAWLDAAGDLTAALRSAEHGRTLASLGFGADVDFAAQTLAKAPVPAWSASSGLLVPLSAQ